MNNKETDKKPNSFLLWYIVMIGGGIFLVVNFAIQLPWDTWLEEKFPVSLAIGNAIAFGIALVLLGALPKRSISLNVFLSILILVSAFVMKVSLKKAPYAGNIILFISVMLFLFFKHFNRTANRKEKGLGSQLKY